MAETRDSRFSRDLLRRFVCGGGTHFPVKPKEEATEHGRPENVELSLGLSLNGRFGGETRSMVANGNETNNKLFRASSVTDFVNFPVDVELSLYSPLTRTCSLPPETEAEWRKRKELQSLRRSEAKRKRVAKLKNVRVVKGKTGEDWEASRRDLANGVESWGARLKQSPPSPPQPPPLQFSSQGSIGSQGSGGSSGLSDLDSYPLPGTNNDREGKDAIAKPSVPNQLQWNPSKIISGLIGSRKVELSSRNSSKRLPELANAHCPNDQTSKTTPTDMPCVSTKGVGPDGKQIQGFLYRYGKGEDVRIVCVCHGSFLTPAEFVKHGGGHDVEHPLRHIVVNSSSFS